MNITNFFHAVSDIIFQYYIMLLLHNFNVFGYNSNSYVFTVTYLLQLFFSHLSVCNCKGSTAENCSEEASRFGKRNVKPINKLIGTTK